MRNIYNEGKEAATKLWLFFYEDLLGLSCYIKAQIDTYVCTNNLQFFLKKLHDTVSSFISDFYWFISDFFMFIGDFLTFIGDSFNTGSRFNSKRI